MEKIVILGVLIVVMEFAVEGIKKIFENFSVWKKIKTTIIPYINIIVMTGLIVATGVTILDAFDIPCEPLMDYIATILICSLGSSMWHEFKKKIKEEKENKDSEVE